MILLQHVFNFRWNHYIWIELCIWTSKLLRASHRAHMNIIAFWYSPPHPLKDFRFFMFNLRNTFWNRVEPFFYKRELFTLKFFSEIEFINFLKVVARTCIWHFLNHLRCHSERAQPRAHMTHAKRWSWPRRSFLSIWLVM